MIFFSFTEMLSHLHASKSSTLKYWQTWLLWNTHLFIFSEGKKDHNLTLYIYSLFTHVQQRSSGYFDYPQCWASLVPHCARSHLWDNTCSIQPWPGMLLRPQGLVGLSLQMCPLVAGPLWYTRPQESWETAQAERGYRHYISVNTREVATKKSLWSAYVQRKIWPVDNEVDPGCTWSSKDKPKYSRVVQ